eukprot:TRINITY_DN4703_c0_g1_i2.p1 TRINITY_DN4703_c0_g1~~TRINITY_DN4703_c0_g1_i2.p1  ORF type:complete len:240 (-),score=46.11 TRINITY_DN4703_c0_g1_i2:49-768(-)
MCCEHSPVGNLAATGGLDCALWVYPVSGGSSEMVAELSGHQGRVNSCSFLSDNRVLTTSGDCTAALWDIPSQTSLMEFNEHKLTVSCCAVAPNNQVFATGSDDCNAKLWDLRQGTTSIKTIEQGQAKINSIALFSDESTLVTGLDDSSCRLYDIRASKQRTSFEDEENNVAVTSVALSRTDKYLFVSYEIGAVVCWNTMTGTLATRLPGHSDRVCKVQVSPDGTAVATASWDSSITVWA